MAKTSLLGNMRSRIKTTVVLPKVLVQSIEKVCYVLGVPKNAWITMGVALLTVKALPLMPPGRKRLRIFLDLEKFMQELLHEVGNSL